jgi:Uma2 family endonuclease
MKVYVKGTVGNQMENLAYKKITVADYLEMERNSVEKHEYYEGEIFAMAGAKKNHNLIVSNLIATFHGQFRGRPCSVFPPDMKVAIDKYNHYTYPDVSIVCGESKFVNDSEDSLVNPKVIIEVLSESTEKYDRGKKFQSYRNISSLQEYVLVSTEYKKIEIFTKSKEDQWVLSESGESGTIKLNSIDCVLSLDDVYDKVETIMNYEL